MNTMTKNNEATVPIITTTTTTTTTTKKMNPDDQQVQDTRTTTTTMTEYNNPLTIDNPYLNVLSLIDITYPPLICSTCDRVATSDIENRYHHHTCHHNNRRRRYPCLHPHCELSFNSRTALRFHLSRSHLIKQASSKHIRPEPPFMHYRLMPPLGTFTPTAAKPSAVFQHHSHQCILHPHHQHQQEQPLSHDHHHPNNTIITTTNHHHHHQYHHRTNNNNNNHNATPKTKTKPKSTMARIIPVTIPDTSTTSTTTSPTIQQPQQQKQQPTLKIPSPTTPTTTTTATKTTITTSQRPSTSSSASSSSLSFKIHTSKSYALTSSTMASPTSSSVTRLTPAAEALINSVYHPLYCPCCQARFPRKTNVVKHVSEMHQGQEPYTCVYNHCTANRKHYATRDGLVYHTLRYHEDSHAVDLDENNHPCVKPTSPTTPHHQKQQQQQENGVAPMEVEKEQSPSQTTASTSSYSKNVTTSSRPDVRWIYPR
ncbi:hypothetical protein BDA99DRAFT_492154 [Phascolomyces articulosus]|uniref:C2H2-type domain-containing protein n=1 Tax=Phascolomyces articulosus TaxID=60185 RepID=A0AAD5PM90_9FUNG|nr:hypothetical protein BDA99DRAFT_492154 [Phascolomyces articulosus]